MNARDQYPVEESPADASVEDDLAEKINAWEQESPPQRASEEPDPIVPVDTPIPLAIQTPITWQEAPVIPTTISERAIEIYLAGLEKGLQPNVFGKVGDCGSTPSWFLGSFDLPEEYYSLGEFSYLKGVIDYYAGSFERTSVAAVPGFNTSSVFAPLWADPVQCDPNEGPLACEYRLQQPSVALIMLGTNDQYRPDEFEAKMRDILDYSIESGVLPILASKADDLEGDHRINQIIYRLALEYELPYWNYWRAVQALPNQGMQEDGAHLTWAPNFFDNPRAMQTAWTVRNLTALQVLDAVWQALPKP
ncbi:MAG: SGNH/GDSL hydrolase family protein [Chloroflexi bacterium]|nr:MAG: SGNH/GDSL hydrolase family protein [Chloroflexota bacterium]